MVCIIPLEQKAQKSVDNSVSTPKHLIPQGSITGPVLFSTYMIPLSRDTGCSHHMYADVIHIHIPQEERKDGDVTTLEQYRVSTQKQDTLIVSVIWPVISKPAQLFNKTMFSHDH